MFAVLDYKGGKDYTKGTLCNIAFSQQRATQTIVSIFKDFPQTLSLITLDGVMEMLELKQNQMFLDLRY